MNIGVPVSFQIIVFSGYVPRSGIVGLYSSSIFSFLRTLHTVSIVASPVHIPTSSVGGFHFLHTWLYFLDHCILTWWKAAGEVVMFIKL